MSKIFSPSTRILNTPPCPVLSRTPSSRRLNSVSKARWVSIASSRRPQGTQYSIPRWSRPRDRGQAKVPVLVLRVSHDGQPRCDGPQSASDPVVQWLAAHDGPGLVSAEPRTAPPGEGTDRNSQRPADQGKQPLRGVGAVGILPSFVASGGLARRSNGHLGLNESVGK